MTPEEDAVLQAAARWARALEAQADADEEMKGQDEAEEALKNAEVDLYVAVLNWRAAKT